MNILAHLHLATQANSSLLGNAVADFVRGNPYSQYSDTIAEGIMFHRRIDVLVDSLPHIQYSANLFSPDHRRIAPIALDVIWDHFLALHWDTLINEISLLQFSAYAEQQIVPHLNNMPQRFQTMNSYLWQERWLERYAELDFIAEVLKNMALRRPKLIALATCIADIKKHYRELQSVFYQFYPELIVKAQKKEI